MKLLDNLFSVKSFDPESKSFSIALMPDCVIYKAHFPGNPVTPGVCLIGIVSELLELLCGQPVELIEVVNAKFVSTINPIERPEVNVTFTKINPDSDNSSLKVNAVISDGQTVCSKLSLKYRK